MARPKDYGIWEDERKPQARQLKDGKWECIAQADMAYCKPDGRPKRFKRTADTKEEAEKKAWIARNKYEYECKLSVKQDEKEKKTFSFGQYMEKWMKTEKKKTIGGSTYKVYRQCLDYAFYPTQFSRMQLDVLTVKMFEDYLNSIDKKYSESVLRNMKALLYGLCDYLLSKNLIEVDFMRFAKTKREKDDEVIREKAGETTEEETKEILSDNDILTIYNNMKKVGMKHKYLAAYLLQIECCLRSEELFCIRLTDIDKKNKIIVLRSALAYRISDEWDKTGKGKKYELYEKTLKHKGKDEFRIVKLSKYGLEAVEQLETQLIAWCQSNPKGLLLPNYRNGEYCSISSYETMWKSDCKWLGIIRPKGFGPHKNRHTGITTMNMRATNNEKAVMKMTGHRSRRAHDIYTHQEISSLQAVKTPLEILESQEKISGEPVDPEYELFLKLKEKFEGK